MAAWLGTPQQSAGIGRAAKKCTASGVGCEADAYVGHAGDVMRRRLSGRKGSGQAHLPTTTPTNYLPCLPRKMGFPA
eukprot:109441-Chlamydomonas_euryale.AAC.4